MSGLLGVELEPQVDEGQINVGVELESGTAAETTKGVIDEMYEIVTREVPEAEYIMTEAGQNSPFRGIATHRGELRITLVSQEERERSAAEIANVLRPLLMRVVPGSEVRTRIFSGNFGRRRGGGGDSGSDRLTVEIRGHNQEITEGLSLQVRTAMMAIPGVVESQISRQPGLPEMVVKVDRLKAASMGMTVEEVADTLETAVGGRRTSFFREEGDEYDIVVRLREQDRLAIDQIGDIPLRSPGGRLIDADQVVRLQRMEGPTQIDRVDQQRIVIVSGTIADRDLGSIVADLDEALAAIPRPNGYEFRMGGEYEDQVEAFNDLNVRCNPGFGARVHGDGGAVRVLARPADHHLFDPAGCCGSRRYVGAYRDDFQHAGIPRRDHPGGYRRQQRHRTGRLHEPAAPRARSWRTRSSGDFRGAAIATNSHDDGHYGPGLGADGVGNRRRLGAPGAYGANCDRRATDLYVDHPGLYSSGLRNSRGALREGSRRREPRRRGSHPAGG